MSALIEKNDETLLYIKLTPNANSEDIFGVEVDEYGQTFLKVRIRAVPEKARQIKHLLHILPR